MPWGGQNLHLLMWEWLTFPQQGQARWNGAGEEHGSAVCLTGLNKKGETANCSPESRG